MSEQIYIGEFCGTSSRSRSGRFMIAYGIYLDRNDTEDRCFLLAEGDHILCQGKLKKRIESAAVDDDGNFCLEQGAEGEKARTCLLFFRRDGTQYGSVYAPGYVTFFCLEDHGRSVLLSYDETLFLISVSPNRVIFSFAVPQRFYPTDGYIDTTTGDVFLADGDRGHFRFTQSGDFPDQSTWLQKFMATCDGPTLYRTIREIAEKADSWTPDEYSNAAGWIQGALRRGIEDSFHLKLAEVYAFLAELCSAAGDHAGHAEAREKENETVDGFRLLDSVDARIKGVLATQDAAAITAELRKLDKAEAYPRLSTYPNYVGRLYKLRGELYLALDQRDMAAAAFRRAIEINPKVGCKRQLEKLEKTST